MNRYELKRQGRRLMENQQEFLEGLSIMISVVNGLKERLSSFEDYLQSSQEVNDAEDRLSEARQEMSRKVLSALGSMQKVFGESNTTINENTDQLEKLLSRFESYFANTNLDYDN